MREPPRLIEKSEQFARLAEAHRRLRPSSAALPDLLRALDAQAQSPAHLVTSTTARSTMKWAAVGLGAIGVAAFVGWTLVAPPPDHLPPPVVAPLASPQGAPAAPPQPAASVVVAVADLPSAPAAPRPAPGAPRSTSSAHSDAAKRQREVELIVSARRALSSEDADGCLSFVDLYGREYPAGQFALEAEVMKIEATLARGDRARAAALTRAFLAAHPGTHYEARLLTILSSTESP